MLVYVIETCLFTLIMVVYDIKMFHCIFCKHETLLYDVHKIYGNTKSPIKEFIMAFFDRPDLLFEEGQGICKPCVTLLDLLLFVRNIMYTSFLTDITNFDEDCILSHTIAFHRKYHEFLKNLDDIQYNSDLLSIARTSPSDGNYNSGASVSYSAPSVREGSPNNDREVQNILGKKKRGRSRRRRRAKSTSSGTKARTHSRASVRSEPVRRRSRSIKSLDRYHEEDKLSALRFDNMGRLLNKNTRSVSKMQDEINAEMTESVYTCINGCREMLDDLTMLTEHKIKDHKMLAKYWCSECYGIKFTSQEDLDKHNSMCHNVLISNCMLCSEELMNQYELQKHLEEHRLHSIPCKYCDMFFLSGRYLDSHIKERHKGRKFAIKKKTPQKILDRIDKTENSRAPERSVSQERYSVQILIQPNNGLFETPRVEDVEGNAQGEVTDQIRNSVEGTDDSDNVEINLPENSVEILVESNPSDASLLDGDDKLSTNDVTDVTTECNEVANEEHNDIEDGSVLEEECCVEESMVTENGKEIDVTPSNLIYAADVQIDTNVSINPVDGFNLSDISITNAAEFHSETILNVFENSGSTEIFEVHEAEQTSEELPEIVHQNSTNNEVQYEEQIHEMYDEEVVDGEEQESPAFEIHTSSRNQDEHLHFHVTEEDVNKFVAQKTLERHRDKDTEVEMFSQSESKNDDLNGNSSVIGEDKIANESVTKEQTIGDRSTRSDTEYPPLDIQTHSCEDFSCTDDTEVEPIGSEVTVDGTEDRTSSTDYKNPYEKSSSTSNKNVDLNEEARKIIKALRGRISTGKKKGGSSRRRSSKKKYVDTNIRPSVSDPMPPNDPDIQEKLRIYDFVDEDDLSKTKNKKLGGKYAKKRKKPTKSPSDYEIKCSVQISPETTEFYSAQKKKQKSTRKSRKTKATEQSGIDGPSKTEAKRTKR